MKRLIPILVLCGLLTSCATKRQAEPRRYHTLNQKANVTLQFDHREYSMNCGIQMWRNELIVLSLQPVLGIEMFRIEATPDSMIIIDKMNRRYTTLAYDLGEKHLQPTPSFKMIQNFITPPALPKIKASSKKSFEVGNHRISIGCTFWQRDYNTLADPKRIDLKKYKRVSLRDILPI